MEYIAFLLKIHHQKMQCEKKLMSTDDELVVIFLNKKRKKQILSLSNPLKAAATGEMSWLDPRSEAFIYIEDVNGAIWPLIGTTLSEVKYYFTISISVLAHDLS